MVRSSMRVKIERLRGLGIFLALPLLIVGCSSLEKHSAMESPPGVSKVTDIEEIEDTASDADDKPAKTEKPLKIVPLLTSSPLLGLGVGAAASYLYDTCGSNSSKSQLEIGGQTSNTDSYVLFANNKAFFGGNRIRSNTLSGYSSINNEFESDGGDVSYNVSTPILSQALTFRVGGNSYLGGILSFKKFDYKPNNSAGADFLLRNGITEERTGGIGVIYSYDTRTNNYYPTAVRGCELPSIGESTTEGDTASALTSTLC